MGMEDYFNRFYDHLERDYSKFINTEEPLPNTKEYYLQKLMLRRNHTVIIVNVDSSRKLQIGSQQSIKVTKGQTCIVFKKSWRNELVIRVRDFMELEDLMYELQSKHILNLPEFFFIEGDNYELFILDTGLEEISPESFSNKVFNSQLKSAMLSEHEFKEKVDENIERIPLREAVETEFKQQFPERAIDVAKELIAFANTTGGKIYFGVDDDGFVIGISDSPDLERRICGVSRNCCEPELNPTFVTEKYGKKEILIVFVDESKNVHRRNDGKFFKRIGANCVEMSVDEIEKLIIKRRNARMQ